MKWTENEIEILKKIYNAYPRHEAVIKIKNKFPHKNSRQIKEKIRQIFGLVVKKWTENEIEILKDIYRNTIGRKITSEIRKKLTLKSIPSAFNKAKDLGLTKQNWTNEEKKLIESWVGIYPIKSMVTMLKKKGYTRTPSAIKNFIIKNEWSTKRDVYSANEVAIGFGCSCHKISNWIESKKLPAKQKSEYKNHEIKPYDVAQFIRNNSDELNNFKPDIPWIVALLDEFRKENKQ